MKRYLLVHYGEIGLKLGNKDYFVNKLRDRLRMKLEQAFRQNFAIKHILGRLLVKLPSDFKSSADEEKYVSVLGKIFGIKNFKFVFEWSVDLGKLGKEIWNNLPTEVLPHGGSDMMVAGAKTFRVSVKRSMLLPFKSFEAERDLGAILLKRGLNMKAKMKDPDFIVDVEFFDGHAYFSYKKYPGLGGLSANSQGKLISLISSGIDSPVASYLMMKRGARVIFVHFHSYPYGDKDETFQVKDLVKILSDYQFDGKLYLISFGKIQRDIATNLKIPARLRTVLYRRLMLKIAEKIARKEKAKGLITGDSFGQVASQTPENLMAIHDVTTIPLFQPLIGFDKEEVIKIAEKIGTYEISKLPCKESCTMFMPDKPEIRADVYDVRACEEKLPVKEWVEKTVKEREVVRL